MKDLDEASFLLGIEIHIDGSRFVLGLSKKAYMLAFLDDLICILERQKLT